MRISDWSSDVCSSDLRQDRMAPRGHLAANLLHGDQIDHAGDAGDPAADRTHAGKPEASAPPEFVKRPQVGEIRRHQADRKSVVKGKSVSVSVDLVGRRVLKKKIKYTKTLEHTI